VSSITGDALMTSRLAMEGEVDDVYSSESNKPVNFASRIVLDRSSTLALKE
jgi:hypothetical protein